jgi:hypothetical protein
MFWSQTQTEKEWVESNKISEHLRHERLNHENSLISPIETTPPGQPIPQRSLAQYREEQIQKQSQSILDLMNADDDFIPM